MWKIIEKKKLKTPVLIIVLISINLINYFPKIAAPPPPLYSDRLIGEILANRTLTLNLLNSNVIIVINSSDYPDDIQIDFNANYTIFNIENDSILTLGLPISLGINVSKSNFSVKLNDVPTDFQLKNYTQGATNNTEFDLDFFTYFNIENPIIIIKCNLTILKYETLQVEFDFNGPVVNPLNFWDDLYLGYYLNTSKTWNGNTTGKVEFRTIGKNPPFSTSGEYHGNMTVSDIFEGRSCIWEWNNMKIDSIIFGIYSNDYTFYPYLTIYDIFMIIINIAAYILIASAIIHFIVKKKSRKDT